MGFVRSVKWVDGSRISGDVEAAAKICEKLESEGRLNGVNLAEEARPVSSPIHDMFEWDDSMAAAKFREQQGNHIIRSIEYVIEETPIRYFQSVAKTHYVKTETAIKNADMRKIMLDNAYRDLEAFRRKYRLIKELTDVMTAIDTAICKRS